MEDRDKDKEQLQNELTKLRRQITGLEKVKTSQKQTEKKLEKSEELYRLIAENTADVITLHKFNLKATFSYISPSGKDIGGYDHEELLDKSPFDFIHPDDRKKLFLLLKKYMNAKVKKLLTGKESTITERIEYRFKDKKGNWRYFQSTGNILGNQLLFITRDITDHKKTEEALNKSQQEFASLFKSSPEALVYVDEKSKILDINAQFTKLFGYTLEEIKGRNVDNGIIHPQKMIDEGKKLTKKALKGFVNYETYRKRKDGSGFPVFISSAPIKINNKLKGLVTLYQDITERQKMVDDLKSSEEKYRSLYENMPGAYYCTDKDGNLIMINPEGTKLFGYNSFEDVLGKNIAQYFYFTPEERKKYLKELEKK